MRRTRMSLERDWSVLWRSSRAATTFAGHIRHIQSQTAAALLIPVTLPCQSPYIGFGRQPKTKNGVKKVCLSRNKCTLASQSTIASIKPHSGTRRVKSVLVMLLERPHHRLYESQGYGAMEGSKLFKFCSDRIFSFTRLSTSSNRPLLLFHRRTNTSRCPNE